MRTKYVLLLAALLAIACALPARTEIPIVQADTVFQGFGGGSVSGIVFGPAGETVIVMHDAQPVEININTKKIVREFEKVPNALNTGTGLFIIQEKGWICCNIQSSEFNGIKGFYGLVIWDYNTGQIINSKQPAITSNGKQFYTQIRNNDLHKQYFCRYDINNLSVIDSVEFDQGWFQGNQTRFSLGFGIVPNSNKVIIGVNNKYPNGKSQRSSLYVLDFKTKQYISVEIPFEQGQDSSEIIEIKTSATGKYFVVSINLPFDQTAYLFYDKDFKFIFKESIKHLNSLFDDPNTDIDGWIPYFINDDYLISNVKAWSVSNHNYLFYSDFFDIGEKSTKKRLLLDWASEIVVRDNAIAILFSSGKIALLNLEALQVEQNNIKPIEKSAEFQNGVLTINSEIAEKADINIIDYKGNIIYSIKGIFLTTGKNSVAIDFPLSNGIYFAIVKTLQGDYSYKFIVSR